MIGNQWDPGDPPEIDGPVEHTYTQSEMDAALDSQREQVERLTDLVRYARHFLHDKELISDEEYAALVVDHENGNRVARLEGYDRAIKSTVDAALIAAELRVLDARIKEHDTICDRCDKGLDEEVPLTERCSHGHMLYFLREAKRAAIVRKP